MKSWDPTWEKVFQGQAWGAYPGENVVRFVARNFYGKRRDRVKILEVGCGPGANLWYLAREGFGTYGIDASPTAVRLAQERMAADGLGADVRQGDIVNLPWPDRSFDAIIDVECLYANDRRATEVILREIRRVLLPGGLLFSQTLSREMAPQTKSGNVARTLEFTEVA
ncbi:MAG: methyltransferase domain-containing protein, partial [Cyanobacteria bacterium REEB65]|nr:methyltransferase domain-containing protein [Cyanobacteria bacterium REEB65]